MVIPVIGLFAACGESDDEASNGITVTLSAANLTEDGYFDGLIYYKITSNSSKEVTVNKSENSVMIVEIPTTVNIDGINYKCTSISKNAFQYCNNLISVTIPVSVTSIGYNAFYDCSGLKKVIVKDLAAWCSISFGNNSSNPLYYAHHLYSNEDSEITNLVIPNGVTNISSYAFSGCSGLTSVTIPASVTGIGDVAFSRCSGLTSVTIPVSVTSIGNGAFDGCSGLTSVTIPVSVTSIGDWAFSGCSGLTSVTIPASVMSIGGYAFDGCSGLTSVTIPVSVTSIGDGAFQLCTGLTSVTIPAGVTSIGDWAFWGCSGLTSITIPASVTSIGNHAFDGCSDLTSVTIGNSITYIGYEAFYNCRSLTTLYSLNTTPPTLNYSFDYTKHYTTVTVYVPKEALEDYQNAFEWELFENLYAIDDVSTAVTQPNAATDAETVTVYTLEGKG